LIDKKDAASQTEMRNYLDILSDKLKKVDNLSLPKAQKVVNEALQLYVKNISPNFYTRKGILKRKAKAILGNNIIIIVFKLMGRINERKSIPVPPDLEGWQNWNTIEKQIIKYDYIYKK